MLELFIKGLLIGIVFGVPAGAIGALTIQRTLEGGFLYGFLTGMGSSVADVLYGIAGIFGITVITGFLNRYEVVCTIIGSILIILYGIVIIRKKYTKEQKVIKSGKTYLSGFGSAFAIAIMNPATVVSFMVAFTAFGLEQQYTMAEGSAVILGILIGTSAWWAFISFLTKWLREKFTDKLFVRMNVVLGALLILFGISMIIRCFFNTALSTRTPNVLNLESQSTMTSTALPETEQTVIMQNSTKIDGVMYRPDGDGPFPVVILTHGFAGNYTYITENIAKELSKAGFAAYAFNLRNPDTRSMKNTSVLTEAVTLNEVINQIKELNYVNPAELFLLGESQGGFDSAYVAANREDIKALVLYYPAFVLQDDAKDRNPGWNEPGYEFQDDTSFGVSAMYARDALSFDIYDEIDKFKNDVLIVHGTQDTVVPLSYSKRAVSVYDHAELKIIEGATHGFYSGNPFSVSTQYTIDFLRRQIKE
ncbi:MAG: LysE family transporter [Lachnospiraceae bacterium]|nr:LysE family transporter [Lachnospiraceae bacterium]MDD3616015.1 LysE family transporter [Lachnospiraceae bacterium]